MDKDTIVALWHAACALEGPERMWARAEVCAHAVGAGLDEKAVASLFGLSCGTVRQMVKTFWAFPRPEDRSLRLSFDNHRVLADCPNAVELARRADEKGWRARHVYYAVAECRRMDKDATIAAKIAEGPEPEAEPDPRRALYIQELETRRLREHVQAQRKLNLALLEQLVAANRRRASSLAVH